jgi:hypothetical protein
MILVLGEYEIEGSTLVTKYGKFSLFKNHVIEKGKKAGEIARRGVWYETTFEKCLQTIAKERLTCAEGKLETVEYLKKYEEITNKLIKEIQEVNKTLQSMIK